MKKDLIIFGAGGHAVSVGNVAISAEYEIVCYVDDRRVGQTVLGVKVISREQCLNYFSANNLFVAIGDNHRREKVYRDLERQFPGAHFPNLIHETAVIGEEVELGEGGVFMPFAHVGPRTRLGKACILNTRASLDHDCLMSDFASLSPGVTTGGSVVIGPKTAVGVGASIQQQVTVGATR